MSEIIDLLLVTGSSVNEKKKTILFLSHASCKEIERTLIKAGNKIKKYLEIYYTLVCALFIWLLSQQLDQAAKKYTETP